MRIDSLKLQNFRNYKDILLTFHPHLNIIYGDNAQGKTNLLEAMAYLSLGNSFRQQKEENLLAWDSEYFYLEAELNIQNEPHIVSMGYGKKRRLWRKNGVVCSKKSDIAGFIHTVVFVPDDLLLVKKGPELRRLFLDREMVQLIPGFYNYLNDYRKALVQRNNLLKQMTYDRNFTELALLEVWEDRLAEIASEIIVKRAQTIEKIFPIAANIHSILSSGEEKLIVGYDCSVPLPDRFAQIENEEAKKIAKTALLTAYSTKRSQEMSRGMTLYGPHRDDLFISVNDVNLRNFGSQGQQRTAALALKLSEVELVYSIKNDYPVLLLDDVLSELDSSRREALAALIFNKAQIFITTTDKDSPIGNKDGKYFHIKNGNVVE